MLSDKSVNVKLKLASLWASLMFLIIYLDYFHLYMPGKIEDILAGKVFEFEISQGFLLIALVLVSLPALMIFLSISLSAKLNRWLNIIVGAINIPFILFNLAGEAWIHMVVGAIIQVGLLCLIIHYAWRWPRI
ncbi:DUF6326 family protein [Algoriphagus confluentis]|uniref:DUF6326 family protein n=1 Tax=Algoriphagus confluentis TaxID=1697556 RepID=A0ABQ6PSS8_9BACT|nr:DUF6326 family protein [Algoriphagus confluentis]